MMIFAVNNHWPTLKTPSANITFEKKNLYLIFLLFVSGQFSNSNFKCHLVAESEYDSS